jgi:hypothetical protein
LRYWKAYIEEGRRKAYMERKVVTKKKKKKWKWVPQFEKPRKEKSGQNPAILD